MWRRKPVGIQKPGCSHRMLCELGWALVSMSIKSSTGIHFTPAALWVTMGKMDFLSPKPLPTQSGPKDLTLSWYCQMCQKQ